MRDEWFYDEEEVFRGLNPYYNGKYSMRILL